MRLSRRRDRSESHMLAGRGALRVALTRASTPTPARPVRGISSGTIMAIVPTLGYFYPLRAVFV